MRLEGNTRSLRAVAALAVSMLGVAPARAETGSLGAGISVLDSQFNDTIDSETGSESALTHGPAPLLVWFEAALTRDLSLVLRGAFGYKSYSQGELEALDGRIRSSTTSGGSGEAWRLGAATGARWRFADLDWMRLSAFGLLAWDGRASEHAFAYRSPAFRVDRRRAYNALSLSLGAQIEVPLGWGLNLRGWVELLDARKVWVDITRDADSEIPTTKHTEHFSLTADLTTSLELAYVF